MNGDVLAAHVRRLRNRDGTSGHINLTVGRLFRLP